MEFFKGDCLEIMKTLPEKSIDCFVCDLPYGCLGRGTGALRNTEGTFGRNITWDVKIDLEKFWTQIKRLAKDDHTPVIMFCTTKFGAELIASNPSWFRYDIVWSKPTGIGFLNANKQPLRSHEMIYIFSKKGAYYKRVVEPKCSKSVVEIQNKKGKGNHPTQKPEELYEWLLKRYCPGEGTILDPTAGSFTSCFTAQKLGLKSIGIEMNNEFYEKAIKLNN
jgi:site-specific DNA-methyltransferase (adenine-specific)